MIYSVISEEFGNAAEAVIIGHTRNNCGKSARVRRKSRVYATQKAVP